MVASKPLALVVAAATTVALAAPALAAVAPTPVGVTVVGLGGTRDFRVEDLTGATLTKIDLGTGGLQPFRTHVTDTGFLPRATGGNYDVTATLSNLYLNTGTAASPVYNYAVAIPSKDVKIGFGSKPLSISGLSLVDLPKLSLTGALGSCSTLSSSLQSILGLSTVLGALVSNNTAVNELCATLLANAALPGATTPVTATIDGTLQTLTSTLTDVTKYPTALSGTDGGPFTKPAFEGVGAADTAGIAAAGSSYTPTGVALMSGRTAGALDTTFATSLLNSLTSALAPGGTALPLVSSSGAAAQTTIAAVVSALQDSTDNVASQLGAVINGVSSAAGQASLINSLLSLTPLTPTLSSINGVTGSSYAFPVLSATPTAPTAGTYGGTMTVTFIQS